MDTLPFAQRPRDAGPADHPDDALWEFHSELPSAPRGPDWRAGLPWLRRVVVTAAVLAGAFWVYRTQLVEPPVDGILRVESDPQGAAVEIDGSLRGLTPFTAPLPAGTYSVVVIDSGRAETISARVAAGVESVHHVRLPAAGVVEPPPPPTHGTLRVLSEPAGALVAIDGVERGPAPVTATGLEPGEHEIAVRGGGRAYTRTVSIEAGMTTSIVVTGPPPPPSTGWLLARSPAPLQIFDGDVLVGTTADRIVLPAGSHDLDFVEDALGFRTRRRVTVGGGETTSVSISLPQAAVNINAVPWADVWIDGSPVGQTPIANLLQTIGAHDVEFRHPELGVKTTTVIVSLREPARITMDMR